MKKKTIACLCILLVGGTLIWLAGLLVTPKYMSKNREGALIAEYYNETTSHDVIFLGDCEVYESFTPPTLWERYGITSYIRGTPQQLVWQSYYLLEDTLKTETPKAVVFNVYAMRYGEPQNEAYNRITLDGMRWSGSKVRAIHASKTEEETVISYVLPLLRYHNRWKELTAEDVRYLFKCETVSHNGYLMQKGVRPMNVTLGGVPLDDPNIPERAWEYLEKMRALCEEKEIQLILIKAPTNFWGYYWYDEWEEQIASYATEKNLPYYNFIPKSEEIGIDWSLDTYDGGAHLNVYGAEKLTAYFGKILQETFHLADHRADPTLVAVWKEKLDRYNRERNGE